MLWTVLSAIAWAKAPATLAITVHAPDGRPVPNAAIRFLDPDEYVNHCVNTADGSWMGASLFLPGPVGADGAPSPREVAFQPGTDVHFAVAAPGFQVARVRTTVGKATALTVTLDEAADGAPLPYGYTGSCGIAPDQRKDDPADTDRRALDATACGQTVVLRGQIGLLDLALPAPTDGSRWTTPHVATPSVLDLGPGHVGPDGLKQVFGFREFGEASFVVDRLAADGAIAESCVVRAIMRPRPG